MDDPVNDNPSSQVVPPTRPLTPPVHRGPQAVRPSQWPGVIGTISMVLGCLAVLGGCFGVVFGPIFAVIAKKLPDEAAEAIAPMGEMMVWMVLSGVATTLIGAMLAVGGWGLIKRRRWCRSVCMTWAVLKMLLVIASSVMSFFIFREQMEMVMEQGGNAGLPPFFTSLMRASGAFGVLIGILWGWAFPVFILIWFSRQKIRTEAAGWGTTPTEPTNEDTPQHEW